MDFLGALDGLVLEDAVQRREDETNAGYAF